MRTALGLGVMLLTGDAARADDSGWLWAFAPAASHTTALGWTASAGLFVGRRIATPSEGYASGVGALLQLERSAGGRRYALGAHWVVKPDRLPIVGTLGGGVNVAYVERHDAAALHFAGTGGRVTLVGPEVQLAFVLRLRVGYMFQTSPSTSGNHSGLTWSVGIGF